MVRSDITNYVEISKIINTYYRDPEKAMLAASGGV
jgi:hypothetical protein